MMFSYCLRLFLKSNDCAIKIVEYTRQNMSIGNQAPVKKGD